MFDSAVRPQEWLFIPWCCNETMNLFSPLSWENKWLEAVKRVAILFSLVIPLIGLIANCFSEKTSVQQVEKASSLFILHVDDERMCRKITAGFLKHFGHSVVSASSVDEALALVEAQKTKGKAFDLVITDYIMPEKDGFDMADALRDRKRNYLGGVILLTGSLDEKVRRESVVHGIDDCVEKGKKLEILRDKIEFVFKERKRCNSI